MLQVYYNCASSIEHPKNPCYIAYGSRGVYNSTNALNKPNTLSNCVLGSGSAAAADVKLMLQNYNIIVAALPLVFPGAILPLLAV